MSEQKHTPEPWSVSEGLGRDYGSKSFGVAAKSPYHCVVPNLNINQEDARRIVACVNACAGIPTETLEHLPLTVRSAIEVGALVQQRDELAAKLAALKEKQ